MSRNREKGGFTLLELLLAVSLLAVAASVTFMVFFTATRAWKRGVALADSLHHGDFVIDQLCLALRSAYYPDTGAAGAEYGFTMEDQEGSSPRDTMSWVKLGGAMVGRDWPSAGSPHRVIVSVEQDASGRDSVCVRAWRLQGEPEEFDPMTDVEPMFLSRRVLGLNCRPLLPTDDGTVEWGDEWEETNRIPLSVEITLYMEPVEEGEPPVEVKRIVQIPVAKRSWDVGGSVGPGTGTVRPPGWPGGVRPPGGISLQPPGSGANLPQPGSGGRFQPPGAGGTLQPPGSGGRFQPPGTGGGRVRPRVAPGAGSGFGGGSPVPGSGMAPGGATR